MKTMAIARAKMSQLAGIVLLLMAALMGTARAGEPLLPNPRLTPGEVALSEKNRQGVTLAMERRVFANYGLPWARRAEFKIDHLIPKELGGADSLNNLWPQSRKARPYTVRRKEVLTKRLIALVESGHLTLAEAQRKVSEDWISTFIECYGMVALTP